MRVNYEDGGAGVQKDYLVKPGWENQSVLVDHSEECLVLIPSSQEDNQLSRDSVNAVTEGAVKHLHFFFI